MNNISNEFIKYKLSESIDDTILNRLADVLFCPDNFHSSSIKTIMKGECKLTKEFIIEVIISNNFEHPNMIRLVIALLFTHQYSHLDVCEILKNSILSENSEISYSGLYCYLKLIPYRLQSSPDLIEAVVHVYRKTRYIYTGYVINNILGHLYLSDLISIDEFDIANVDYLDLITIILTSPKLQSNHVKYMLARFESLGRSDYVKYSHLYYFYSLLPSDKESIVFKYLLESNIMEMVNSVIKFLQRQNMVKITINSSSINQYLWNKSWEYCINDEYNIGSSMAFISEIPSNCIGSENLKKILNEKLYHLLLNVIYVGDDLNTMINYSEQEELIDTIKYNVCVSIIQSKAHINQTLSDIREDKSNIFMKLISSLLLNESYGLFLRVVGQALISKLSDIEKFVLLKKWLNDILVAQVDEIVKYFDKEGLSILKTLASNYLTTLLELGVYDNEMKIENINPDLVRQLLNLILNKTDFNDELLFQRLFYICLILYVKEIIDDSFVDNIYDLMQRVLCLDIMLDLPKVLKLMEVGDKVERVKNSKIMNLLRISLENIPFKPVLNSQCIENLSKLNIGEEKVLQFSDSYCPTCEENMDELIEDFQLHAPIKECFGE